MGPTKIPLRENAGKDNPHGRGLGTDTLKKKDAHAIERGKLEHLNAERRSDVLPVIGHTAYSIRALLGNEKEVTTGESEKERLDDRQQRIAFESIIRSGLKSKPPPWRSCRYAMLSRVRQLCYYL